MREAFPYDSTPRYPILDRGSNFNEEVIDTVKSFGIQPNRTSFRSPWQNGVAELWVGNCRRDLLDHVIVLNGRVVGTWKRTIKKDMVIVTPNFFAPLNEAETRSFVAAANGYGAFLGMSVNATL